MDADRVKKRRKTLIAVLGTAAVLLLVTVVLLLILPGIELARGKAAPTIRLELLEGPELDGETGLYRYLIEAVVTGEPAPDVYFNLDGRAGEVDGNRLLLFLGEGENFLVEATASNEVDTAGDSLRLVGGERPDTALAAGNGEDSNGAPGGEGSGEDSNGAPGGESNGEESNGAPGGESNAEDSNGDAGGDEGEDEEEEGPGGVPPAAPNRPPVVSGILFNPAPLFTNEGVTLTAQASDPDGDPLSYHWRITSGGWLIEELTGNPVSWTAPPDMGHYRFGVTVSDGRGGETEYGEEMAVNPVITLTPYRPGSFCPETGRIKKLGESYTAYSGTDPYIGDGADNGINRGFISFNVDHLTGATVHKVQLRLEDPQFVGNPGFLYTDDFGNNVGLIVQHVAWSDPYALISGHYNCLWRRNITTNNKTLNIIHTSTPGSSTPALAQQLQAVLDAGEERFQLRLRFARERSNNDGKADGVLYHQKDIQLIIWCEYW